jgi:glutathione S-transferase
MAPAGTPILWHIEISHYNEKARWALDYKGIPHVRKAPLPGIHQLKSRQIGGAGTLPLLQMDGQTFADSTEIIAGLERRQPDPPLYPADPADRARALELEDLCDEKLAPEVRSFLFFHVLDAGPDAAIEMVGATGATGLVLRAGFPVMKRFIGGSYGVAAERAAGSPELVRGVWDQLEEQRGGRPFLVGDSFTIADLTAAAISHPIARPAEFEYHYGELPPPLDGIVAELQEHPHIAWVRGIYAEHRPPSAEIASARAPAAV